MSSRWPSGRGFAGYSTQSKTIQLTYLMGLLSQSRQPPELLGKKECGG
jgi:hypothetical protein